MRPKLLQEHDLSEGPLQAMDEVKPCSCFVTDTVDWIFVAVQNTSQACWSFGCEMYVLQIWGSSIALWTNKVHFIY